MKAFASLLDGLVYAPQRNAKLRLIKDYLARAPDPDRGYGVAALTGDLSFPHAKPALIRSLVAKKVDPTLFALSYDYVGDLAETAALIWPDKQQSMPAPSLGDVVHRLSTEDRNKQPGLIRQWLDRLDASGRYALLKLLTGGLRVGASARLTKTAVAAFGGVSVHDIEELWHGLQPPYEELFAWLEGRAEPPRPRSHLMFRPMMLATPMDETDLAKLNPEAYAVEWKWDGIRVQIAGRDGNCRMFSRTGDDISSAFPDIVTGVNFDTVLDGELLVLRDGIVAPFNDLQRRLGRKRTTHSLLSRFPAHVRLYDILFVGDEDLRCLSWQARRKRLEEWLTEQKPLRMDLSQLVPFEHLQELALLRERARTDGIEGLMLKRRDSPYVAGRPKGPWFKWKREPLTLDCVVMYAQRGHGKRSSFYSDFTFGCWTDPDNAEPQLVPVGKAYSGFTDKELLDLDRWVRAHTTERYGPVRAVQPALVLEIAFDAVHRSRRHKSGVAMRFPRISRIRWDKPAADADCLATVESLV